MEERESQGITKIKLKRKDYQFLHPEMNSAYLKEEIRIRLFRFMELKEPKMNDNNSGFSKEACQHCGYRLKPALELHHKLPRSQGGTDDSNNLILLCANCHSIEHHNQIPKEGVIVYRRKERQNE